MRCSPLRNRGISGITTETGISSYNRSMAESRTQFIVDQVKALPIEEQLRVAEAIDRLTWAQRWREICERIAGNVARVGTMTDDEIDAEVREVRKETPLSERSSIPRS